MTTQEIILNIAVNLSRQGRYAMEGKEKRVKLFIEDNVQYIEQLKGKNLSPKFQKTYQKFLVVYKRLASNTCYNDVWAEEAFTWANILTHRTKLA